MIFLFEFKIGHKAAEATCNINKFGPGTANKCTVWWSFWKWDNSLDDEEHSDQPLGVDKNQLRASIEADPLTTTWEVAKELYNNHSVVACHLKQTGKMKNWKVGGCLWADRKSKIVVPKSCLHLLYATTKDHFLMGL